MVAFFVLPLTTIVLGPQEYGAFAIVSSLSSFGLSISTAAGGMLLPAHYTNGNVTERGRLVSALLVSSLALVVLYSIILAIVWPLLVTSFQLLEHIEFTWLVMSLLAMAFSVPWSLAYIVVILEGRARTFAVMSIVSSIVGAITVLFSLFVLKLHTESLFLANLFGATVLLAAAVKVLRGTLVFGGTREWFVRIGRITLFSAPATAMEVGQTLAERWLLGSKVGLDGVGIYTNAQQYRNILSSPLKALSNSIWPHSLIEARDPHLRFELTGRVWNGAFVGITLAGVFFAILGRDTVSLLTHGKFADAGPLAAAFIAALLVQFSGKPQTAVLYANDQGEFLSKLMGVSAASGVALLFIAIPLAGYWGAIGALLLQQILYRLGVHLRARIFCAPPMQDSVAAIGVIFIGFGIVVNWLFQSTLGVEVTIWLCLSSVFLVLQKNVVIDSARQIIQIISLR